MNKSTTPHMFALVALILKASNPKAFYQAYLTSVKQLPTITPRRYASIIGDIGDTLYPSAARAYAFFHNIKYAVYAQFSLGDGRWSERLPQGYNMSYADAKAYCEEEGLIMMSMDEWNRLEEKSDSDADMEQLEQSDMSLLFNL